MCMHMCVGVYTHCIHASAYGEKVSGGVCIEMLKDSLCDNEGCVVWTTYIFCFIFMS
jgi:hypothetical protein